MNPSTRVVSAPRIAARKRSMFAFAARQIGARDLGAGEVVLGLEREHPLEREHGALGLAGVVGGDSEQVVVLDVPGALALVRQEQLVGFAGAALLEKLLRAIGELVAKGGA